MLLIPQLFSFEMNSSNFYIIQNIHIKCTERWNKWKTRSNTVLEWGELWKCFRLVFLSGTKCIKGQRQEQSATGGRAETHTAFKQRRWHSSVWDYSARWHRHSPNRTGRNTSRPRSSWKEPRWTAACKPFIPTESWRSFDNSNDVEPNRSAWCASGFQTSAWFPKILVITQIKQIMSLTELFLTKSFVPAELSLTWAVTFPTSSFWNWIRCTRGRSCTHISNML